MLVISHDFVPVPFTKESEEFGDLHAIFLQQLYVIDMPCHSHLSSIHHVGCHTFVIRLLCKPKLCKVFLLISIRTGTHFVGNCQLLPSKEHIAIVFSFEVVITCGLYSFGSTFMINLAGSHLSSMMALHC